MLHHETINTARALLEQPEKDRRQELRRAFPGYFRYCLFHILAWPYLALRGWKAAGKRQDRDTIWLRLSGGTRPANETLRHGTLILSTDLGETRTSLLAAEQIRATDPDMPVATLVLMKRSYDFAGGQDSSSTVGYVPYNNPISMLLMLKRWNPQTIIFSHHSHYFNHLAYLSKWLGVKTVIVNASISDLNVMRRQEQKQQRGFISWRWTQIGTYAVQAEADKERFAELGIDHRRIVVAGPIYATPERTAEEKQAAATFWKTFLNTSPGEQAPVIVAGSTYPVEEEILLQAFGAFQRRFPAAVLVLAPRYLNRDGGADSVLKRFNVPFIRRSQVERRPSDISVVLLDTFGELKDIYFAAAASHIGGTFDENVGGHTPVEALACGIPMTMGPYYKHQVALVDDLVTAGLLTVCRDFEDLCAAWTSAGGADEAQQMRIRQISEAVRTDRVVERLYQSLLQNPAGDSRLDHAAR